MAAVERDDDPAEAGVDRDRDEVLLRRGPAAAARRGGLGESRARRATAKQRGGEDSVVHGDAA